MKQVHYLSDVGIQQYKRQVLKMKSKAIDEEYFRKLDEEKKIEIATKICRIVYLYLEVPFESITDQNRKEEVILAKHFSMHYTRLLFPKLSYSKIGSIFGLKAHATVLHAVEKVRNYIQNDNWHRTTNNFLEPKIKELLK